VAAVYRAAALRQGVDVDLNEISARFRRAFGQDETDEAAGSHETSESNEVRRWRRLVGQVLPDVPDLDRAFAELWEHFGNAGAWRFFGDVEQTVSAIAALGRPMAVASNFDSRLRSVLRGFGAMSGHLGTLVVSSEVGWRKPHPSFYAAVSRGIGLAPDATLYVTDDPEHDLPGARRAGFRAVFIDRKAKRPEGIECVLDLHALVPLEST
jgi:putative hydrolase of the HAD superfamily